MTLPAHRSRARRIALGLLLFAATAWGALALWYPWHLAPAMRGLLVAAWATLGLATLSVTCRPAAWTRGAARTLLAVFAAGFALLLGSWLSLAPQQDRDWADDVSRLLASEVVGDRVTLHNVRNFEWRTQSDYTPRWETRGYDLSQLVSADMVMSYWMGPPIAHTLVSFGFEDGSRVVFSLEIRKERDESFSALGGFFRKFEQVIVAADERDIVRVRSNVRGEDVYLYRLDIPPAQLRQVFRGYLQQAAGLQRRPAFYNTLTSNCTTIVFDLARQIAPGLPLDYRLLLSGYFDGYAYDHNALVPGHTMQTLKTRGRITERARAADDAADFSIRIREGIPGMDDAGDSERAP
ncbi:DUF4105 domain-containing protein [Novilysobacter antarcticus]|uniref:Lnb N-terminal periplasmic domain-containing protein n=1 Tax=Novilysobacter antarcticus TaxID=2862543 RepID=UPI001C99B611|nr:DUF4105 domain-containing protein [Lysobacter antarcticus]